MRRRDYRIRSEPHGTALRTLLAFGAERCDRFLLTRTAMTLTHRGNRLAASLEGHLIERSMTTRTPSGDLFLGAIEASTYRLDSVTLGILTAATDRLYEWQEPDLPNDLCLLTGLDPWLMTLASEEEAILALDENDFRGLRIALPALELLAMLADS